MVATMTLVVGLSVRAADTWVVDTEDDWKSASAKQTNVELKDGMANPTAKTATFTSKVKRFDSKRQAASIVFDQSPIWQNWTATDNLGPANLQDAPVFLQMGSKNYWVFGRYGNPGGRKKRTRNNKGAENAKPARPFKPQPARLDGFDIPLQTTPWPNQFNAPGGLNKGTGGYHAWQSRDMVNWVHHGPVTESFSRWVTSAEQVDDKVYIFYDYPNDQDPHVYVDKDLTDGKPGKNLGLFGDFDPVGGHHMAVGWFTSSDINKPFTWCDQIGNGHPDPDVGFAEGRFYLFTQQRTDWISPGPWVETVEARVDTDNDGRLDNWLDWTEVKETYDYCKGFSKYVDKTPAKINLTGLAAGFGFGFEFRLTDSTTNKSKPMMDKVRAKSKPMMDKVTLTFK